jgi:hypothetical protein
MFVTAPRFTRAVSTMTIKLGSVSWGHPLIHLLLLHSSFTTPALCLADTHCFLLLLLVCSLKVMSHCSPLGEAAAAAVKVENMEEITVSLELEHAFKENPAASDGERYAVSPTVEDDLDEGASDNVKLWMCYFGSLTTTTGKIKEMEKRLLPGGQGSRTWG